MNPANYPATWARVRDALAALPRDVFSALESGSSERQRSSDGCIETMLQALELTGTERVLETGSSSGYETALLSRLAHDVVSLEGDRTKAEARLRLLGALGCENVRIFLADGSTGWAGEGPYQAILVAAGASRVPEALLTQLAVGGRMVIPLGDATGQVIHLVERTLQGISSRALGTSHLPMLPWARRPSVFPWSKGRSP